MKKGILLFVFFGCLSSQLFGQISITSAAFSYTQDFDLYNPTTLANLNATIPTGWTAAASGTAAYRGRGTGTSTSGGFWAFGSGSEFSLGGLRSGTPGNYIYTVAFTNNTGLSIKEMSIGYDFEQWGYANTSGLAVTQTNIGAVVSGLDAAGVASGTNGTVSTTAKSITLTGLSIADGVTFTIKFTSTDVTGSDNSLGIDNFTLNAIVLPLELTSFSAQKETNTNNLAWQTATETNVSHFDIQRSSDGQKWQSIGEVKAAGNSRDEQHYEFSDENPLAISYYRLRSVDLDGAEQFSGVERVVRASAVKTAYVLPTSVQDQATVVVDSDIETETSLTIFDQTGRQISTQSASLGKGENRISLEVNSLPQGIYTIRFGQNEAAPLRFVKK